MSGKVRTIWITCDQKCSNWHIFMNLFHFRNKQGARGSTDGDDRKLIPVKYRKTTSVCQKSPHVVEVHAPWRDVSFWESLVAAPGGDLLGGHTEYGEERKIDITNKTGRTRVKADGVQKLDMIVLLKVKTLPTFLCNTENMIHCRLNQFYGSLPWDNGGKPVQNRFFS